MPKRKKDLDQGFADRIRDLMNREKLKNSRELSKEIGIHKRTIDEWLNGRTPTYPSDLKALSDFFHVDLDYLLLGKKLEPSKIIQINLYSSTSSENPPDRRTTLRREEDKLLRSLLISLLSRPTE